MPWLKMVVKGDINRLFLSAAHAKGFYVYGLEDLEDRDSVALAKAEYKGKDILPDEHIAKSPEDLLTFAESEKQNSLVTKLKIEALLEACNGRPELEEIVYAVVDDKCPSEAKALAKYLGRPVNEIYQQLRALRRKAEKIIKDKEWTKNGQE